MTINNRIQELVDIIYSGNKRAFSQAIGVSPAVIENIVGKRQSNPSYDITYKIISSIDNVDAEWLITGKGDMFSSVDHDTSICHEDKTEHVQTKPRIPLHAAAGSLSFNDTGVGLMECEQIPVISALPKYDFTIFANGDSMMPEYHSGDELACLSINNKSFIQWGRVHVLDTRQGIVVKRIFEEGEYLLCESNNTRYSEFKIPKSEVFNMALVVGLIRRY